jgi:FkbM family methyltransferase
MFKFFSQHLATLFPALGVPKRFLFALIDSYSPVRKTYSQHSEDLTVNSLLKKKFGLKNIFYIDIGANHPTTLSNTYLLYRNGARGLTIDANIEMIKLHRQFRSRDLSIALACGSCCKILKFFISNTPVLSSSDHDLAGNVYRTDIVPMFTLNLITSELNINIIHFLNIDVEGNDYDVLVGANAILSKTFLVCIEANSIELESKIKSLMFDSKFILHSKIECNLFFINTLF